MNTPTAIKMSLAMAGLLALPLAHAANLSKPEYEAVKTRISADHKAAKGACAALAGNAKDVCVEEADAQQKVGRAELEYRYSGKPEDLNKLNIVKAESNYAVAKEKCDDRAGNAKDVCVQEAKAAETKAIADAKMGRQMSEARVESAEAKRDADYKVAAEKCDALSGDAKASCVAAAKASFGKS